jgi:hypothetical protein
VQPHNVLLRPRDERPGREGQEAAEADGRADEGLLDAGSTRSLMFE